MLLAASSRNQNFSTAKYAKEEQGENEERQKAKASIQEALRVKIDLGSLEASS
jgi:hypothetical protein